MRGPLHALVRSLAGLLILCFSTNAVTSKVQKLAVLRPCRIPLADPPNFCVHPLQGVVTFDGLIITANSSMNTTSASGLNYTITFSAASTAGITSWDVPINIRLAKPLEAES